MHGTFESSLGDLERVLALLEGGPRPDHSKSKILHEILDKARPVGGLRLAGHVQPAAWRSARVAGVVARDGW